MKKRKFTIVAALLCTMLAFTANATLYTSAVDYASLQVGDVLGPDCVVNFEGCDQSLRIVLTSNRYSYDETTLNSDKSNVYFTPTDITNWGKKLTLLQYGKIVANGTTYFPWAAQPSECGDAWEITDYSSTSMTLVGTFLREPIGLEGEGTSLFPYLLTDNMHWRTLYAAVQNSKSRYPFRFVYFRQDKDLEAENYGIGSNDTGNTKAFYGSYDGANHNLTVDMSDESKAVAPFYRLGYGAQIRNLRVDGKITGGQYTSGLVAYATGYVRIESCRSSATITCKGTPSLPARGGGFVGLNTDGTELIISQSMFDGKFIKTNTENGKARLGAFVGWGDPSKVEIETCVEQGTYQDAVSESSFCWYNNDVQKSNKATNCGAITVLAIGDAKCLYPVVSGTEGLSLVLKETSYPYYGHAKDGFQTTENNNFIINEITHKTEYAFAGNQVKFGLTSSAGTITEVHITSQERQYVEQLVPVNGVYTFTQPEFNVEVNALFGVPSWTDAGRYATEFSQEDAANKTIYINSEAELARVAKCLNTGYDKFEGWTLKLTKDLDMSACDWDPAGYVYDLRFRGTFDGQNHVISGINCSTNEDYQGLFAFNGGTIKNVKLSNSNIKGANTVGAIVGDNRGHIFDCVVDSTVTVTGNNEVGGIAGSQSMKVENVDDAEIGGCYSAATVTGDYQVGGIIGLQHDAVAGCLSRAKVSGGRVSGGITGQLESSKQGWISDIPEDEREDRTYYIDYGRATLRYNVSMAQVSGGGQSTLGYREPNLQETPREYWINDNYCAYPVTNESDPEDYYMYPITLSDELKNIGAKLSGSGKFINGYGGSGLTFYDGDNFTLDGDLYYNARFLRFRIEVPEGYSISKVMVNDTETTLETDTVNYPKGTYFFEFPSADYIRDAVITADINSIVIDAGGDDNSAMLYYNNGKKLKVTLKNRTLYKDGRWNTLTLPFDLNIAGSPLDGAEARTVTKASISGNKLDLTFGDAVTTLQAGVPYIIKWASGDNIVNPVFNDVTINSTANNIDFGSGDTRFRFMGTYDAISFTAADCSSVLMMNNSFTQTSSNNLMLMANENMIGYVTENQELGASEAYFKVGDDNDPAPAHIDSFNINIGEQTPTSISLINDNTKNNDNTWYTIDGRRLSGKPSVAGIYINGGKKVVIK